jgi:hypothetical protein
MIRKPPADWQQQSEGAAVRTVRAASVLAKGSASVARRGGHVACGVACYFFAVLWGFTGLASGLATESLPSIIGIGAMVAFALWAGSRAFAKARATSG